MSGLLSGWTVVVTRAEPPGGPLGRAFSSEGARVLHVPTVAIAPPPDPAPLRRAVSRLETFHWLVLTSPRAVAALAECRSRLPDHVEVAVVGRATAERARSVGFRVDVVGSGEGGEALANELVARGIGEDVQVFFPASSRAGKGLVGALEAAGANVEQVVAYETRSTPFDPEQHPGLKEADVVSFTSPSAVEGWVSAWAGRAASFLRDSVRYVAIGATTDAALEEQGLPAIRAPEASFEGVVEATRRLAAGDQA